ncbi:9070_t:CDS:10, partial [Dentiscutata erythropus]
RNFSSEKEILKRTRYQEPEPLQELYRLCPDLNGQSVWFFLTLDKSAEGRILYEKSEKHVYVYNMITQNRFSSFSAWIKALGKKRFFKGKKSSLATIFLNPSSSGTSVGQIIKGENHVSYFKSAEIITLLSIKDTLTTMIHNDAEFTNITLMEGDESLRLIFSDRKNTRKELCFNQASHGCREPIKCSIFVNRSEVKDIFSKNNCINTKISTMADIISIVRFCKKSFICMGQYTKGFEQATRLRGNPNSLGSQNDHEIIASLENKRTDTKTYRRVDCAFFVPDGNICINCKTLYNTLYKIENRHTIGVQPIKTSHASREILTELTIKSQKELIKELSNRLKLKFEAEEEHISEPMTNIIHSMIEKVKNKEFEDIPNLILKELIRVQRLLWSQRDNRYVGYVDFDNENAEIEAFGEQCLRDIQNDSGCQKDNDKKDCESYFAIETIDVHTLNTILFSLAAKLKYIAIHTCGSICDGAGENRRHVKSFDWFATTWKIGDEIEVQLLNKLEKKSYKPSKIIAFNPERTKFLVELSDIEQSRYNIARSVLWPPMPKKLIGISMIYIEVAIKPTEKGQQIIWRLLFSDIRPAYDENQHWAWHLAINSVTGKTWFFLNNPTHVFKKLRNNVSKSHTGSGEKKSVREIIKMRVDLAEHTLSQDVKNAIAEIPELMNISQGTQCQFDLILSINGFLGIIEYVFRNWPGAVIQPRRISQDMLEGLFGTIREMSGNSSTQTVQSYGYAMNKFTVTTQMISEIRSLNYGSANSSSSLQSENQDRKEYIYYKPRIEVLSTVSHQIFKEIIDDDLIMGRVDDLLVSWSKKIRQMALNSVPAKKKSLVLQLFEKHTEYEPDILIYINNNLTNNQPLKKQFHTLLQKSYEYQYDTNHLSEEDEKYLFMRQKNNPKVKFSTFKKEMLPKDLNFALDQLKIWAHDDRAKSAFEKAFTLSNLKTIVQ